MVCYSACQIDWLPANYTVVDIYCGTKAAHCSAFRKQKNPVCATTSADGGFHAGTELYARTGYGRSYASEGTVGYLEAVFTLGKDGYPARIWDKYTGVIDKQVSRLLERPF